MQLLNTFSAEKDVKIFSIFPTLCPPEANAVTLLTVGLRPSLLDTSRHIVPLLPLVPLHLPLELPLLLLPPPDGEGDHLSLHEGVVVTPTPVTELQL